MPEPQPRPIENPRTYMEEMALVPQRVYKRLKPWRLFHRHQQKMSLVRAVRSSLKATVAIFFLAMLGYISDKPMLVAPFAASCILMFSYPDSPSSQPANVIFGYLLAAFIGILFDDFAPHIWWFTPIVVCITIASMNLLRITHPPAGALPLLLFLEPERVHLSFLLFPTLTGSIMLVVLAIFLHSLPPARIYPRERPKGDGDGI